MCLIGEKKKTNCVSLLWLQETIVHAQILKTLSFVRAANV